MEATHPIQRPVLEVIGFNIESCVLAQASGAQRIELCASPGEGGTTPSYGLITAARKALQIPLYPIIRPRGGDFLYTEREFEQMKTEIQLCKQLGCDGVVIGMLLQDGSIDQQRCGRLVELAYPMGVTFHRAFDRCANPFEALETIISLGCERILTSGQQPTAPEGTKLIAELIQQAADRIIIMPGSGVRSDNLLALASATGAHEFHSSARKSATSQMSHHNISMQETLEAVSIDTTEVQRIIGLLKEAFNSDLPG